VLREAVEADIPEISALYEKVFKTYPIPLNQPQYVELLMDKDYLFMVITHEGTNISCALADINYQLSNAEITDCASLPEYRGQGLMFAVIGALEKEVQSRGIKCLYSIARALSPGMNTVFKKLGYTYTGRLVNNCNIFGKFEDMNLWVKKA
jgi:putative beta-lysine N-acetyltransferase